MARAYDDVGQLIAELDLTDEDMARARETTDEHVLARTQVLAERNERSRPGPGDVGSWPDVPDRDFLRCRQDQEKPRVAGRFRYSIFRAPEAGKVVRCVTAVQRLGVDL